MDLLVFLAEQRGAVVSKSQIVDEVWAGDIVSDGALTHAIREGRLASELCTVSMDSWSGTDFRRELARIYAMVGKSEPALDEIEFLLSTPNRWTSDALFRLDPRWDALRGNPRFVSLMNSQ